MEDLAATTQAQERASEAESPEREAARLADLFGQLMSKTLSRRLLAELPESRSLEITTPQFHAMRYLWLHPTVVVGALAEGLDISYPSATNMVKRLQEKALVDRVTNPADRREVEVVLTEKGRALTEAIETARLNRFTELLNRLDATDRAGLLHGLRRFIREAAGDDARIPRDICLRCGWHSSENCPLADHLPHFPCP